MKFLAAVAVAGALAAALWQEGVFTRKAPPAAPPPPPAILSEPAPVVSDEEMRTILKSAQDTEPSVRWEAVVFLNKVKAPQAMTVMQEMLKHDGDRALRIKIVDLLGVRAGDESVQTLLGSLRDQEPEVRLAALRALDKIGDFSVASVIAAGPIRDQDERVRLQSMKTLNSLQDRRERQILEARKKYEAEKAAAAAAAKKR